MILGPRRYDQHETHCDFTAVTKRRNGWHAKAKCTVEGSAQTETLELLVSRGLLTTKWGRARQSHTFVRC